MKSENNIIPGLFHAGVAPILHRRIDSIRKIVKRQISGQISGQIKGFDPTA